MLEEIKRFLVFQSYKVMSTNVPYVQIYSQTQGQVARIIVMSELLHGTELTREQYGGILQQVRRNFENQGYYIQEMLSLLCTNHPSDVSEYCEITGCIHWILDLEQGRVIIYENQPTGFQDIQRQIETILSGNCHQAKEMYSTDSRPRKKKKPISERLKPDNLKVWYRSGLKRQPIVTILLIVINILVFIAMEYTGSTEDTNHLYNWGGTYYPSIIQEHQYYRLITSMFLHSGFDHIFNNMLVLALIGERLERTIGSKKYLIIYMLTGIFANVASIYMNMWQGQFVVGVGASGAIFGVVGAMAYLVIRYRGANLGISPSRLLLFIGLSLYSGFQSYNVDNTAHIAGFISGVIMLFIIDTWFKNRRKRTRGK